MKILHVSTSDTGGAAKAAIRIHLGMLANGVDSNILFLNQTNTSIPKSFVFIYPKLNTRKKIKYKIKKILQELKIINQDNYLQQILSKRKNTFETFTFPDSGYDITSQQIFIDADIINLHWVAGFIDYSSFFKRNVKKIFWTLHDLNPFTGGCHCALDCNKYTNECKDCHQISDTAIKDIAENNFNKKLKSLSNLQNLSIISPSSWLLDKSKKSKCFKLYTHHLIQNGHDVNIFKPRNKVISREIFNIPNNAIIFLFLANPLDSFGKGLDYLIEAHSLIENQINVYLCLVGSKRQSISCKNIIELGSISDERLMSIVYSAADATVIPSIDENFPNTAIESLLCGIPVISFNVGGLVEIIRHGENGVLCGNISSINLSKGIDYYISNKHLFNSNSIRLNAIKEYSNIQQALKYVKIYEQNN